MGNNRETEFHTEKDLVDEIDEKGFKLLKKWFFKFTNKK